MEWHEWNPGDYSENTSLAEVLNSMPPSPIGGIPRIIQLFENPTSPYCLSGPTDLRTHDIIHILLGRGMLQQDEAFVIGYSMGNAYNASALDRMWFLKIATNNYPHPFTFSKTDAQVYNLAFDFGLSSKEKDIHNLDVSKLLSASVLSVRQKYDLSKDKLVGFYTRELEAVGLTKVSKRIAHTYLTPL